MGPMAIGFRRPNHVSFHLRWNVSVSVCKKLLIGSSYYWLAGQWSWLFICNHHNSNDSIVYNLYTSLLTFSVYLIFFYRLWLGNHYLPWVIRSGTLNETQPPIADQFIQLTTCALYPKQYCTHSFDDKGVPLYNQSSLLKTLTAEICIFCPRNWDHP